MSRFRKVDSLVPPEAAVGALAAVERMRTERPGTTVAAIGEGPPPALTCRATREERVLRRKIP